MSRKSNEITWQILGTMPADSAVCYDDLSQLLSRIARNATLYNTQSSNNCSYEWACAPAYERRMNAAWGRLEAACKELTEMAGAEIELNSDPRGSAVKARINNRTYYF